MRAAAVLGDDPAMNSPLPSTVAELLRMAQRRGPVTLSFEQLKAMGFDQDGFQSPLDELRHLALSTAGSITVSDRGGGIMVEYSAGKRPSSMASLGQRLADRRRMLGMSVAAIAPQADLPREKILAVEAGTAGIVVSAISPTEKVVEQYTAALTKLEGGRRWMAPPSSIMPRRR